MNDFNLIDVLDTEEYVAYQTKYLELIKEEGVLRNLHSSLFIFNEVIETITPDKYLFSYATGKWSLQEVLLHIIDTERIFQYRVLSISRGEQQELPGFEEDDYVLNSNANQRTFDSLINEFWTVRASSIQLFENIEPSKMNFIGVASKNTISVRALGYLLSAHMLHHLNIIKERYL